MSPTTRRSARTRLTCPLALLATLATLVALAGCQARDRAGGGADRDVTVLTFAQPNDGEPPDQLTLWADQVSDLSDGSLEIEFENGWRPGEPTYESATIDDVRAGKVDLTWVGARALDRAGITSFEALLAPMLVDSHALQAAVFEEGIAAEMLDGVAEAGGDGVTGIGVLPGPLRKLLGVDKPFVRPADFVGTTVGMQDSGIAERTFAALGAESVALPSGEKDLSGVDAYEQQLQSIWGNQYQQDAGYLTANLDLWPRPLVLFANDESLSGLDGDQRDALRKASEAVLPDALAASRAEDASDIDNICGSGLDVRQATADDLAELEAALAPLYDELREDARTATWLDRIAELKERVGAPPDTMTCDTGSASDVAGPVPEGLYRNTLTTEDVERGCQPGDPGAEYLLEWGQVDHVQELEVEGSHLLQTTYPVGHPEEREPGWSGDYRVFRDTIELREEGVTETLSASWAMEGTSLVISDMLTETCDHPTVWTSHPWELVSQAPSDPIEGDYVMTASWGDTEPAGCPMEGPEGEADEVIYELGLHDGQINMYARIGGADAPQEDAFFGPYSVFRDRVQLGAEPTLSAAFSLADGQLRFSDMFGGACGDVTVWTTNPWVKVQSSDTDATSLVGSWSTTFDEKVSSETILGTYTMTFRDDGTMELSEPAGDIGFYGNYSVFRGRVEISGATDTVSVSYAIDGDELSFTDLVVPGCDDCEPYVLTWEHQPWVRDKG